MTDETTNTTTQTSSLIRYAIWTGALALLAVLGWGVLNVNAPRPEPGEMAPDFDMQFFDGYEWQTNSTASLSDLEGQVVVLNFWAEWCVECRLEADMLEEAWLNYKDQGVTFLGITYIDPQPNSLAYLEEFNVTYPNAPDLRSAISQDYEITGVPETFFIGRDGRIAHVQIGPVNPAMLSQQIEVLLAE